MYKVGIVGTGFGEYHLESLSELRDYKIEYLCYRTDLAKAKSLASKYNIPHVTDNYLEIMRSDVDVVVVVAPVGMHYPIIKEAIKSDKHIVTDKPLALTSEECNLIIDMSHNVTKKNMVFYQWRFNNRLKHLKYMLKQQEIGNIYAVNATFYTDFMADENIGYGWRHDSNCAGGGVTMDMGVHISDLLLWLTSGKIAPGYVIKHIVYPIRKSVDGSMAKTSTEDFYSMQFDLYATSLQHENILGYIQLCRTAHGLREMALQFMGTKGTIRVIIDPFTGVGKTELNGKPCDVGADFVGSENPYYYFLQVLAGENADIPVFQDGLNSILSLKKEN